MPEDIIGRCGSNLPQCQNNFILAGVFFLVGSVVCAIVAAAFVSLFETGSGQDSEVELFGPKKRKRSTRFYRVSLSTGGLAMVMFIFAWVLSEIQANPGGPLAALWRIAFGSATSGQ